MKKEVKNMEKFTKEQEIESFIKRRLWKTEDNKTFSKRELAIFCLKEIDDAIKIIKAYENLVK